MLRQQLANWIARAARAPSAHNTQPACWYIDQDDALYLVENLERHLKVADPDKHDQYIGLGAAYEGLKIAASEDGALLAEPEFTPSLPVEFDPERYKPFARTRVIGAADRDPLASQVLKRATYRGKFSKIDAVVEQAFRAWVDQRTDILLVEDREKIREIADQYDRCAVGFSQDSAYYKELYSWLRFNRFHPGWDRDGLNADALSLSAPEKIFGPYVAHPISFSIWSRFGLAGYFVSEKSAITSSDFIVILCCDKEMAPFDIGRYFYRIWLEISAVGLALCPMSALSDHELGRRYIRDNWTIPRDKRLVNVFRMGQAPTGLPLPSARLPVEKLFVE